MTQILDHENHEAVTALLVGQTIVKVDDHTLRLNDGTVLELPDTEGECSCGAGDYALTELNGVDNVITKVEFVDAPGGDGYEKYEGVYQIFVYADNAKINLATWSGSDGNGYYATGYTIKVKTPSAAPEPASQ